MTSFFLGVIGSLLGVVSAAGLGYWFWQKQRQYETRLNLLKESCENLSRLASYTQMDSADAVLIKDVVLQLQSNAVLVGVFFSKNLGTDLSTAIESLGAGSISVPQRNLIVGQLEKLANKLK